jgi:hypothetical protein
MPRKKQAYRNSTQGAGGPTSARGSHGQTADILVDGSGPKTRSAVFGRSFGRSNGVSAMMTVSR